ncbi:MAG: nitrogen regulation protein NR(II) [Myxococcota bacterium]
MTAANQTGFALGPAGAGVGVGEDAGAGKGEPNMSREWRHRFEGHPKYSGWHDPIAGVDEELAATEKDELASLDESLLSDEERDFRKAKKRADQKIALSRAAVRAGLITLPLLFFVPFFGVLALIYFGVGIGRRAFKIMYEPKLRERFLKEEVKRQVSKRVSHERRNLEGEHHRSLEQLSASIAHEIRNPITAAKSLVQQMGEDPGSVDQVEYARVAVNELERVERSISHLLRFAREEDAHFEPIVLEDVLESALETCRERAERGGVVVTRQFDVSGQVEGDSDQLRRVVINLVSNALDALEDAVARTHLEKPEVRVSLGANLAGNEVWIRIADNALGIDEEARERIFDPFYTSREEGTGLGLALCRKIIDEHGGAIEVATASGEGTEFLLTLPRRGAHRGAK